MVTGRWYTKVPNFSSILILKSQRTSVSFKSWYGALEDAGGSWLGFCILILIWICWSLFHPYSKFWLPILILKMQRTSLSSKFWFRALEDNGGSWLGIGILILIWIWSLVFDTTLFRILSLCLYFKGAKNIKQLYIWQSSAGVGTKFGAEQLSL